MSTRTRAALAAIGTVLLAGATVAPAHAAEIPEVVVGERQVSGSEFGTISLTAEEHDEVFGECEVVTTEIGLSSQGVVGHPMLLDSPDGEEIEGHTLDEDDYGRADVRFGPEVDGYVLVIKPGPRDSTDGWYESGAEIEFSGGWMNKRNIVEYGKYEPLSENWCRPAVEFAADARADAAAEELEQSQDSSPTAPPAVSADGANASEPTEQVPGSAAAPLAIGAAVLIALGALWALLRRRRPAQD